ncbi:class I SAM-dependent methyltransferase [Candidatus Omnitrophota bacterium]
MKRIKNKVYNFLAHLIGSRTKKYYNEDFIRVYPDGMVFDRFGKRRRTTNDDIKNFINHSKFYIFAAQFVKEKVVADIGCGAGYGCEILKKAGASEVCGSDISGASVEFAASRYSRYAAFSVQNSISLEKYSDNFFDVTVTNEVLEHIKEYGVEGKVVEELKRITKDGGLIMIGTTNSEMLDGHGFSFDEINGLLKRNFSEYCIFENALIPYSDKKRDWEDRQKAGRTGVIITEDINFSETVVPKNVTPEIKKGIRPGSFKMGALNIDTSLLHNTHSWVASAINEKKKL